MVLWQLVSFSEENLYAYTLGNWLALRRQNRERSSTLKQSRWGTFSSSSSIRRNATGMLCLFQCRIVVFQL